MNALSRPFDYVKRNTDARIVVSSVMATAILGVGVYLAMRSGIKPLRTAAKAVSAA